MSTEKGNKPYHLQNITPQDHPMTCYEARLEARYFLEKVLKIAELLARGIVSVHLECREDGEEADGTYKL